MQFRSRIKSAVDYTSFLSDIGICCFPDGSKEYPSTYISCMEAKGYFQYKQEDEDISDVECPELSSRGCCCACEYVDSFVDYMDSIETGSSDYEGGLKDDITFCECSSIGGVWLGRDTECSEISSNPESIFAFCTNGASTNPKNNDPIEDDVRFPSGCCVEEGGDEFTCYNLCSEEACSEKQTERNPDGVAVYYPTVACGNDPTVPDGSEIICGTEESRSATDAGGNSVPSETYDNVLISNTPSDRDSMKRYDSTTRKGSDGLFSACVKEDSCESTVINNCDGYWMGLKQGGTEYSCSDITEINSIQRFIKDGTVSSSVVDTWEIGSYQLGGFYIGQFWSSDGPYGRLQGFGNPDTGPAEKYVMECNGKEFKSFSNHKYAVIVSPKNLSSKIQFHTSKTKNKPPISSKFDSVRNTNNNIGMFNTVRNICMYNGIGSGNNNSCIVPSLNLSAFIYDKINNESLFADGLRKNYNPAYKWTPMSGTYWTSTIIKESAKRDKMTYVQNFNSGFVSGCGWMMDHNLRTVNLPRIII